MTDISATGTFVCLAAWCLLMRFLPQNSLMLRGMSLIPLFFAFVFAFTKVEAPVPASLNFAIAIIAVLIFGADGVLKLNRFKGQSKATDHTE